MKMFVRACILGAYLLIGAACTDAPQNDGNSKEIQKIPEIPQDGNAMALSPNVLTKPGDLDGEGSAGEQELKAVNLRKPILYGVGVAGITMETTLKESETLLTPPLRGPFENGVTLYNEQLIVLWKPDGDRQPQIIVAQGGYLGTMDIGSFGEINMQTKFTDYKGDDPQAGAAKLAFELYLELEQVEDKSYNCLATRRCQVIFGDENQANVVLVFPGAVFLIAKEEFEIAEIRIIKDKSLGMLGNNIDLLSGDILIPEGDAFQLGQSYQAVFERLDGSPDVAPPDVRVTTDSINYSWNGLGYAFHRSNYDSLVQGSEVADVIKTMWTTAEFPAYLTLGGTRILMTQSADSISFGLEEEVDPATANIDDVVINPMTLESKLKMSTTVLKTNSLSFVEKFSSFIGSEFSNTYDTVKTRIWGIQNPVRVNKDIVAVVRAFDSKTLVGKSMVFQLSEEQKGLSFIEISDISPVLHSFDAAILPAIDEPVALGKALTPIVDLNNNWVLDPVSGEPMLEEKDRNEFHQLAGIELNSLIRLKDIDALSRQEATAERIDEKGASVGTLERVTYVEEGMFETPENSRVVPRSQGFISVGSQGTSLGLKIMGQSEEGLLARVVSISTGGTFGLIQDFCGLGASVQLELGMTDTQVEASLAEAIKAKSTEDSQFKCDHLKLSDRGGLGLLKKVYFPKERLVLNFSDRALGSVSIYLPLDDVAELPKTLETPEVKK